MSHARRSKSTYTRKHTRASLPRQRRALSTFFTTSRVLSCLPHPGCAPMILAGMAVAVWFCLQTLLASLTLATSGVSTIGTVTSYQVHFSSRYGGDSHIVFVTSDGRQFELERIGFYHEGEQLPVLYNPHNPNEAEITSFFEQWGEPVATTLLSVLGFLSFFCRRLSSFSDNSFNEPRGMRPCLLACGEHFCRVARQPTGDKSQICRHQNLFSRGGRKRLLPRNGNSSRLPDMHRRILAR